MAAKKARSDKGKEVPHAGLRLRLTPQQEAFCHFYLGEANRNGTKAARMAGYSGDDSVLGTAAYRLLRSAKIIAYMESELDRLTPSTNTLLKLMGDDAVGAGEFLRVVDETITGVDGEVVGKRRGLTLDLDAMEKAGKLHLVRDYEYSQEHGQKYKLADPHPARAALLKLRADIAERQAKHTIEKRNADGTVETTTVEGVTTDGAAAIFTIGAIADALEAAVEEVCGRADTAEVDAEGA